MKTTVSPGYNSIVSEIQIGSGTELQSASMATVDPVRCRVKFVALYANAGTQEVDEWASTAPKNATDPNIRRETDIVASFP